MSFYDDASCAALIAIVLACIVVAVWALTQLVLLVLSDRADAEARMPMIPKRFILSNNDSPSSPGAARGGASSRAASERDRVCWLRVTRCLLCCCCCCRRCILGADGAAQLARDEDDRETTGAGRRAGDYVRSASVHMPEDDVGQQVVRVWCARSCGRRSFHVWLVLSSMARIAWLLSMMYLGSNGVHGIILNRVAISFYFTAFSVVMFRWMRTYYGVFNSRERLDVRLLVVVWLANIVVYVYHAVIFVLYAIDVLAYGGEGLPAAVFDSDIYISIAASLLAALGVVVYGLALGWRVRAASATLMGAGRRKRRRALWEVSICAVLMAAALLFRMAMYLYRPITGKYLPNAEFIILAYLIPEQVPAVLGLMSQRVSATRLREKLGVVDFDQADDMNEAHLVPNAMIGRNLRSVTADDLAAMIVRRDDHL